MQNTTDTKVQTSNQTQSQTQYQTPNHRQKSLAIKGIAIIVVCGLFLIGLGMIKALVTEREYRHKEVVDEIKANYVGEQTMVTPFLVLTKSNQATPIFANQSALSINSDVNDTTYKKDIYRAISYNSDVSITQTFFVDKTLLSTQTTSTNIPKITQTGRQDISKVAEHILNLATQNPNAQPQVLPQTTLATNTASTATNTPKPSDLSLYFVLPVSDLRGANPSQVLINNKKYPLSFGKKPINGVADYLVADITNLADRLDVSLDMSLAGIEALNITPTGDSMTYNLNSNWSDPKFFGALPVKKTLNHTNFGAMWQSSYVAQANNKALYEMVSCLTNCQAGTLTNFGTEFITKNDSYTKTDRTIKYALILLLVSFGTFFLFEIIKNLKIHPIQYSLVASALLVFYVLLLSLSEYIAFWQAYAIAGSCCVLLIGWYAFYMLASLLRAGIFTAILAGLYGAFYVILASNQFSLLIGAVFCFGLVFVAMFLTRRVNWYAL